LMGYGLGRSGRLTCRYDEAALVRGRGWTSGFYHD
jgi:hypothetical protein